MKKNGVVHFEIYARDAEKLSKFYSTLFDWTIEAMPGMDYHYVKMKKIDIAAVERAYAGHGVAVSVRATFQEGERCVSFMPA